MTLVKRFGMLSAAAFFLAASATVVSADNVELEVCNTTSDDVYFSLAGFDAESSGFEWRSEG